MRAGKNILHCVVVLTALLVLGGCSRHEVRHLSSDACLVVPGETQQQELLGLLGPPDQKKQDESGNQVWYYSQGNKSLLRKTPYIGKKMGTEEYDLLVVTLENEAVRSCVYRSLSEEEYKQLGITAGNAAEQGH